ncbi:DUF732 domain-containing protein [Kitasatospora griseola]|uniref:DUF732 domain-containing protein n=1 Tax=Kitasatospora griseola TaxID=2064 RepID=UPI00166F94EA|nr:DUF732 domain-containing protein [Kitasatospora griseola]GGQ93334.1 hypothetical protein GCM10010195_56470 [Kitasatospora griseola]
MTKQNKTWALMAVAGVLALTACSSTGTSKDKATADPKPTASAPAAPASSPAAQTTSEAPKQPSGIPSPDKAQTVALVAALKAVDPALAAKEDKAVDRARNICQEIKSGKDAATVEKNAAARFTGGSVTVTPEQATAIVAAVKGSFCS